MPILLTGLSHRSAPLAVREALSVSGEQLPAALHKLQRHVGRGVVLSTCNRTEVYTVTRDREHGVEAIDRFIEDQFGIELGRIRPHLYTLEQDEAVEHLTHASQVMSDSADVWNVLGVAYERRGDRDSAMSALKRSQDIEPDNPYMLRNLGALLAHDSPEHALAYLEKAAELLPDDQQAGYGYALCLHQLDRLDEADSVLIQAIEAAPHTELAEKCRQLRTDIAQKNLRGAVGGGLRPDVVMYCLAALEKAAEVGPEEMQRITFEIALLGRSGLDINDPTRKYQLKSLPGDFSGLQLLSYMYVGMRQLDPSADTGADFSKEYQEAERLLQTGK